MYFALYLFKETEIIAFTLKSNLTETMMKMNDYHTMPLRIATYKFSLCFSRCILPR